MPPWAAAVILVRRETTPEDIHGMKVAEGILTELGGMTSHAAVVARGMGVCAITGCGSLSINYADGIEVTTDDGVVMKRGDTITLDGTSGEVMLGDIPKTEASSSAMISRPCCPGQTQHRKLKVQGQCRNSLRMPPRPWSLALKG